jgi:hypothetical protein
MLRQDAYRVNTKNGRFGGRKCEKQYKLPVLWWLDGTMEIQGSGTKSGDLAEIGNESS